MLFLNQINNMRAWLCDLTLASPMAVKFMKENPVKSYFQGTNSVLNFHHRNLYWHFWDSMHVTADKYSTLDSLAVIPFKKSIF